MKKKTPTLGQQRLAKLARYLYSVPAKKFFMGTWGTGNLNHCGSTACAIGHACTLFKNEGLLLEPPERYAAPRPAFDGLTNWLAVEAFFCLSSQTAGKLFGPGQEIGPRKVAQRIKKYLETGKI